MSNISKLIHRLPPNIYDQLEECFYKHRIDEVTRICHFLSQVAHESGNFKSVYENLNYSAKGLLNTFPKYFNSVSIANQYARNPRKIANRVYANRMGNGDEDSGQGYLYRGRGYLCLTGKRNYELFSNDVGEDCVSNPDLVATKYAMYSAVWFFNINKLWTMCDKDDHASVVALTKRINGGTNGLSDRLIKFKAYKSVYQK
jgi:putative chitinase